MQCAICGMPVFQSATGIWFHDVHPRSIATPARHVTEDDVVTIALPEENDA